MTKFKLTRIDKLKLVGLCIQAVTGIIGGSLILTEGYPYTTLIVLSIGAIANELVIFIKDKENQLKEGDSENN